MSAPSLTLARALVEELVALGVSEFVLCPGSRSAPLAYALAEVCGDASCDTRTPRLHVRVDERSAGFRALGLARGSGVSAARGEPDASGCPSGSPVAVITTSGTAAANLHPAVLEASHAGVPLIVITADRPHELRGVGANQTTAQAGLFGLAVREAYDVPAPCGLPGEERDIRHLAARAASAATGVRSRHPGPVHLNVAYRAPLVSHNRRLSLSKPPAPACLVVPAEPDRTGRIALHGNDARTVVVAGDGAGPEAARLAEARGWPLFAEPSSGACGGPNAIAAYRLLLGLPELADAIDNAVVFGRPTLSREIGALLGRPNVAVTVVAPGGGPWPDAARNARRVIDALAASDLDATRGEAGTAGLDNGGGADGRAIGPSPFLSTWMAASDAAASVLRDTLREADLAGPFGALAVADAVSRRLTTSDALIVGASNPIRDLDLVLGATPSAGRQPPTILSNRGLAGIDGTISTASGVALARSRADRPLVGSALVGSALVDSTESAPRLGATYALVGDLTFLHDAGGLLVGPLEERPDLTVIVVNDDGGSIFSLLEHGEVSASSAERRVVFERVFATPHGACIASICSGYGVSHTAVRTLGEFEQALGAQASEQGGGVRVIEAVVGRDERRKGAAELRKRVRAAVAGSL